MSTSQLGAPTRKTYGSIQIFPPVGEKIPPQTKWRQLIAGVAASTSLLASGAWFGWPAPLLPRLESPDSPVPMTKEEISWMVSCVEIGILISPLPATFFSDRFGRKLCMLSSVPLFFVSVLLTIHVKTFISLCIARTIQGFAMGIPYTVLPLYLGEISSPESRGTITSLFHIFWGFGCLFPYCVGPFLSYDSLTYATFMLTLLFVLFFSWQPESPYYYALRQNKDKTVKALTRLRDHPTDESIKKELEDIHLEVKKGLDEKASWNDIIATPADRKALLLIIIVGIVSFLSGQNAILTYTTDTFTEFPNRLISPDSVTIGVGIVALLGSMFSLGLSDKFGRRFLLLVSSSGCMVSLFLSSLFFYLHANSGEILPSYSWVAPVGVMAYNFFVTAGLHPVCVTYTSELFPTKTRGIASSISSINLTICSFFVIKSYELMQTVMGVYFIYFFYAVTCLIGTILFYFMMPETKGKTFNEIREALVKQNH